jgi:aspartate 1-decarboxylase
MICVLKSKIHNAFVTEANIDYIGSITIDETLMKAANLFEGEQVHVVNYRNGERLITYVIKGKADSREICMNGPAALKILRGDRIIIIAYRYINEDQLDKFAPKIIFPNPDNTLN